MPRTHSKSFALLTLLVLAACSASAAFVSYSGPGTVDTGIFGTLVDLNSPVSGEPFGTSITSPASIEVFNSGTQVISFSVPNAGVTPTQINFGATYDFSNLGQSLSQYILSQTTNADTIATPSTAAHMLFSAGTAISAIGIHISRVNSAFWSAFDYSPVTLEVIFSDATTASTTITPSTQATNDPTQGAFYGYSSDSNNIVGFRITGGIVMLDNLRFGSLSGGGDPGDGGGDPGDGGGDPGNGGGDPGNGGGDPGDPAAIPEASTFLLCGTALGLLGLLRRRRN